MTDQSEEPEKLANKGVSRRLFLGGAAAGVAAAPASAAEAVAAAVVGVANPLDTAKKAIELARHFPISTDRLRNLESILYGSNRNKGNPETKGNPFYAMLRNAWADGGYFSFNYYYGDSPLSYDALKGFLASGNYVNSKGEIDRGVLHTADRLVPLINHLSPDMKLADFTDPDVLRMAYAGLNLTPEQQGQLAESFGKMFGALQSSVGADKTIAQLKGTLQERMRSMVNAVMDNPALLAEDVCDRPFSSYSVERICRQCGVEEPAWKSFEDTLHARAHEVRKAKNARYQAEMERAREQEAVERKANEARIKEGYKAQAEQREAKEQQRRAEWAKQETEALQKGGVSCYISKNTQPLYDDPKRGEYWIDDRIAGQITRLHAERLRQALYQQTDGKSDPRAMSKHPPAEIRIVGKQTLLVTSDPLLKKHLDSACSEAGKVSFPAIQRDFDALSR